MAETAFTSFYYRNARFERTAIPAGSDQPPVTSTENGEAAAALKGLLHDNRPDGEVATALSSDEVMIMILDLPATDEAEIEGMVQLQAEEVSPFPPERTCVSWEILEQQPPRSRVLMALSSSKPLDQLHTLFASNGLVPQRVDVDILGWLELLAAEEHLSPETDQLVLITEGESCMVVAWHQGVPCLIRNLLQARELSTELLLEELMMISLAMESTLGITGITQLQIWHDSEPPAWVADELQGWQCDRHLLTELPALTLGLARRALRGNGLNLAPPVWKEEQDRLRNRKKMTRISMGVAAAWLLLMLGLLAWTQTRSAAVRKMENQNNTRANQVAAVEQMAAQVRSLTQFTDRSSSALETLLLLAKSTPGSGEIVIEDYRYRKEEGLVFSGALRSDVQPFYQFLEDLAEDGLLRVTSYKLNEGRDGFNFQVEALWHWIKEENGEEES